MHILGARTTQPVDFEIRKFDAELWPYVYLVAEF